ncbi:MAG: ribonuclease H-like YkuK family protein [Candidatus Levybacteria bacterium]|nr:ribonuclease H-like YkuK family protein [Candidatus Levybacteria bacterium]
MDLGKFHSTTLGSLLPSEVIDEIRNFLEGDPDAEYSLVIGTDSQEKIKEAKIGSLIVVTAIVVHRKGFGGRYFWKKKILPKTHTLREKIYTETLTSLSFAEQFVPLLKKSLNGNMPKYHLEIHVDVGEHGETRAMIKEVVGMVTGNGFVAKTKPEAFGASYVADKHT